MVTETIRRWTVLAACAALSCGAAQDALHAAKPSREKPQRLWRSPGTADGVQEHRGQATVARAGDWWFIAELENVANDVADTTFELSYEGSGTARFEWLDARGNEHVIEPDPAAPGHKARAYLPETFTPEPTALLRITTTAAGRLRVKATRRSHAEHPAHPRCEPWPSRSWSLSNPNCKRVIPPCDWNAPDDHNPRCCAPPCPQPHEGVCEFPVMGATSTSVTIEVPPSLGRLVVGEHGYVYPGIPGRAPGRRALVKLDKLDGTQATLSIIPPKLEEGYRVNLDDIYRDDRVVFSPFGDCQWRDDTQP